MFLLRAMMASALELAGALAVLLAAALATPVEATEGTEVVMPLRVWGMASRSASLSCRTHFRRRTGTRQTMAGSNQCVGK